MKIYPPIAIEDAEYTVTPLVGEDTPIVMTEDEQALYHAWDALQAVPSYVEQNAREYTTQETK